MGIIVVIATWRQKTHTGQCIRNLEILDAIKGQWALETHQNTNLGANPTLEDLRPWLWHFDDHKIPLRCPDGGTYTLGRLADAVTCSRPGHVLCDDCYGFTGWIESMLISAWEKNATELALRVSPHDAENTWLDYRTNGSWHHWYLIPKDVRPRIVSGLKREARLAESAHPIEGDIVVPFLRVQFRWHLRIDDAVGECRMMAPVHPEPNEKATIDSSEDWRQFTNGVNSEVASEARGMQPPFQFQGSWQDFWKRSFQVQMRWELHPEKRIDYIKAERLKAGLQDYDWSD